MAAPIARRADGDATITLKISDMHTPAYQREIDQGWVESRARVFNADLLQVADVSYRDGMWWVVDGLHRRELVRAVQGDGAEMLCRPHFNHTEKTEFELFIDLNRRRRRLSALAEFKSALTLGRQPELSINKVVTEAGFTVGVGRTPTHIGAVRVLYDIYRTGGDLRLRRVLNVYLGAYGGGTTGVVNSIVLDALGIVYRKYGSKVTDERMIRKLAENGNIWALIGMSRGTGSGHGSVNVANAIIDVWNNGVRKENRLPVLGGQADAD